MLSWLLFLSRLIKSKQFLHEINFKSFELKEEVRLSVVDIISNKNVALNNTTTRPAKNEKTCNLTFVVNVIL